MKKVLIICCLAVIILAASCAKSDSPEPTNNSTPLQYTGLVAGDTVIKVNDITTVTANATGDELIYTWTATFGTFIGSGKSVQWTVCHADKFTITCTVTDKYNRSESKSIVIRSRD